MADGSAELVQVPAHSVFLWTVYIAMDLIHFQIQGRARGIGALGDEYNDLTDTWLCRHEDPQDCKCPQGSDGEAPQSQLVSASMKVATSAGDEGVYGTITSISLDQFCKQKQPPTPPSKFCEDARNLQATNQPVRPRQHRSAGLANRSRGRRTLARLDGPGRAG